MEVKMEVKMEECVTSSVPVDMSTKLSCDATARNLPESENMSDVRDGVAAMVEALEILQRVGVHHQHATVAQTDRQRLSVVPRASEVNAKAITHEGISLADGHHAVIGRRLPQSEGLIVADGGTDGEEGVFRQRSNMSSHSSTTPSFPPVTKP
ncbi:hypothetical protein EYF80_035466 [Liparis tanakae]|uniref:Uncharacterized protein n=1 Tax=Liparis tanakae TaxID=230148 RepID=A0A4Z2GLE8_9TELE|nr:hypothetical protein EYF80_035466 [Liparis tanakae]